MSWLQKRPQSTETISYFSTSGTTASLLIIGLGNPDQKYDLTRHNIGFETITNFQEKSSIEFSSWTLKNNLKCSLASGILNGNKIYLIKPQTYMNDSGIAVELCMNYFKIPIKNVLVIHDDLDIDFGSIRTRIGGSSAGHNGIKSIIKFIGEDFNRFRIGIKTKNSSLIDSKDYVLQKFDKNEQSQLKNLKTEANSMLSEFVFAQKLTEETRSFIV